MKTENPVTVSAVVSPALQTNQTLSPPTRFGRRSFVKGLAVATALLVPTGKALAEDRKNRPKHDGITKGDADILRFLAAAELIETDLWQQYEDFALADSPYTDALEVIDDDMPSYIAQNTNDEFSHENFLNAFLVKNHERPVDLERFRTLPGSPVAPTQIKRLTNLMHLNVDTSWYLRYRSAENPDFGATFPQVVSITNRPAIPVKDQSSYSADQIQAIANTAAFHFAMIEQGGSSLYGALSLSCATALALRIVTSIGGTEIAHFEIWHDLVGDAPPVDSGDGLVFPDLNSTEETTPLVMPKPCRFISPDLPLCSIIRPTSLTLAGATAAVSFLTETGLFAGQSPAFLSYLHQLAHAADAARRDAD
jgi:hypothetical protein